jgi:hypothetical protein
MNHTDRNGKRFMRKFSPTVLDIPMLFDEEEARDAGKKLCSRLLSHLGPRYAMHLLPWKLTVTQFPQLAEIVTREASRSPFLLVAINGEKAVTPEVEAFLRRCAAGSSALVLQLHGIAIDQMESSPVYELLTQIAEDSQIPIFSTVVELNQQSRSAGRASPRRNESPFVAFPPQTLPLAP